MVDDIKKAFIFNEDIKLVGPNNTHTVRYRIISDDGQRTSEWSAPQVVNAKTITYATSNTLANAASAIFKTTWSDTNTPYAYDIFVSDGHKLGTYTVASSPSGNIATITTLNNHGFSIGDRIDLAGANALNSSNVTILATPSSKQFSVYTTNVLSVNPTPTAVPGTNPRVESSDSDAAQEIVSKGNYRYVGTFINSGDLQKSFSYQLLPTSYASNVSTSRVAVQIAGIAKQPDDALVVYVSLTELKA